MTQLITEKDPEIAPDTFVVSLQEAVTTLIAMSGLPNPKVEPSPIGPPAAQPNKS